MDKDKRISQAVIKRLPRYYRYIGDLISRGIKRISSKELSEKMNVTASQIRQDLNCFGGFGQQGYGYNIEYLYSEIGKILGLNSEYTTVIIGAGNLGRALANYTNFERRGFRLIGMFDESPDIVGTVIHDVEVMHTDRIAEFFDSHKVDIGILTVPKQSAKEVADTLISLGIKGLWNFSSAEIDAPPSVAVENVHLTDSLMTLSYKIKNQKD